MRRNNGPSEPCPRQRHHENQQLASINITLISQSLSLRFDENRIHTSTKSTVWHPCISPACQTWASRSLNAAWGATAVHRDVAPDYFVVGTFVVETFVVGAFVVGAFGDDAWVA